MKTQENRISKVKSGIIFATPPFSAIKKPTMLKNLHTCLVYNAMPFVLIILCGC